MTRTVRSDTARVRVSGGSCVYRLRCADIVPEAVCGPRFVVRAPSARFILFRTFVVLTSRNDWWPFASVEAMPSARPVASICLLAEAKIP